VAENEQDRLQLSIHRHFLIDLLDMKESPQMTATEVIERRDRQREQFGPVTYGIEGSVLKFVIENTFMTLLRHGQLPEPPEEVVDAKLDIEYTGKLSRLMRSAEADVTEQWVAQGHAMAQFTPDVLDNYDNDEIIRGTADARGVPARYRRDEKAVEQIRTDRAEAQQAAQQAEQGRAEGEAMEAIGKGAEKLQQVEAAGEA
jgi:hypothetical protein